MTGKNILSIVAAVVVGATAGSWMTARLAVSPSSSAYLMPSVVSAEGGDAGSQVSFANGFAPVARKVLPAVVSIASSKIVHSTSGDWPF